ncbi:pyruvate kinase [Motilibacter rhizosphaerae]|uniref:Pyruvate kinase n=1 Tax=Motilibacter rhizosphaerae TaxID=598652 RepID=A0A4Q7NGL6_9ACTN|nr:pyruvate kinase [Motilibacter rhizosphaerae]RZS82868.1 pyruvate kinase [Motilibacter rhizosphaerae]
MRRAKIVCTLGPSVDGYERIKALIQAGMNVARFNLSHADHAEHEARYQWVRQASEELGKPVAVLVDLQGPKIRTGYFADGPVVLTAGDTFTITTEDVQGDASTVSTTYKGLAGDVAPGDPILIDDGRVALKVTSVDGPRVVTEVVEGGVVSNSKGINLPGVGVSVPALSEKDIADLRWALHLRADVIALSFVRDAKDIVDVHRIMDEEGVRLPVIAKVEKPQAVDALEEIVAAFDGIMVARGDLGVELPLEQVPLVQKRAVDLARRYAKPVIVATQMLESMISASRPTRAETSDVANAVLDGADAVMLSGETSVGKFPFETVATMARIVETVETNGLAEIRPLTSRPTTKSGAITAAAAEVAEALDAKYLVTFTQSGDSARRVSRLRHATPLLSFTPDADTGRQLALSWGIETFLVDTVQHTDQMALQVDKTLLGNGMCQEGDLVVIVAGAPPGIPGSINSMRVHRIGDAVNKVAPAYGDLAGSGV